MGKIERFLAKPMEVEIAGQKEVLKPFTLADFSVLNKMGSKDPEVAAEAMEDAIKKLLKQIDPEATPEELDNVSIEYLEELAGVVAKVNNLDTENAKDKLLKKVKEKQKEAGIIGR